MSHQNSPLDSHKSYILKLHSSNFSNPEIQRSLQLEHGVVTTERSLRRAFKRWGLESRAEVHIHGDEAEITTAPSSELNDPQALIEERGLDPEDWHLDSLTVNEWDAPTEGGTKTMKQLKAHLKKKRPVALPLPARAESYTRVQPIKPTAEKAQLIVFTGDQQAPFHDRLLHDKFLGWLEVNQPDRGILIGDTVDFPDISRYRLDPENTAKVQTCIDVGYGILRDYVTNSEGTYWTKLCGNHDERIRNTLLDAVTNLYGVRRAANGEPEPSVLSIEHLLRLDELGIEYLEPEGSYEHMQVNLSPYLAARHGWIATQKAGTSAHKTLEHLGYSVIVGHTHRQSLIHKTTHDIDGKATTLAAAEIGCMCRVEGGLGYAVNPDWQAGFATAHIWPDGKFKIDLATFVNDTLLWRDQRY